MKLLSLFTLAVLSASSIQAQATTTADKAKHAQHQDQAAQQGHMASGWKEMDAFHKLLGATYHPVEKSGDVKPLRAGASDLSAAARAWAASTPPASCNTEDLRSAVTTISIDALAIANQTLANASDADLKTAITALHDKFEKVEKSCGGDAGMKH